MDETATDVIVIGGGMAGISAAARIAADRKVIVLEAESQIGHHATGRSAAMFILNYGGRALRALNAASAPFFADPQGVSDLPLLAPRGEMVIARAGEEQALEDYLAASDDMERLTPDQALALCPMLRPEAVAGGAAIERNAQEIDVDLMLQGFARLLKSLGGQIVTGAPATAIEWRDEGWHVTTPQGVFTAPVLVNAAGAWADQVARLAGIAPVGLIPMRRSAAILPEPEGHDMDSWPMVASAADRWYMKPMSGKLMVSPCDEDPADAHDAWPDDMVLAEGLDRFSQDTGYEVTRLEHSWAGLRSFAPDRTPVAGFAPGAKGFLWLAGQGGYGIQTAPAMAQLAADLIAGRAPALSAQAVAALDPARFS
ncbi:MAG: FAD-dependent oxidoreductase [Paracoccus sp. (in: a-proteobacteria)]|nr:FAD-dependent oxidoreductase [Paracoccus sp. (in: a-proteobacteria)]